jgi:hypothetical protein
MQRLILGPLALSPLLLFLGCAWDTAQAVRTPKEPMAYRTAPDEPTYNRPLEYPKESMDQDPLIKKHKGLGLPGLTSRPGQQGMTRGGQPGVGTAGF